MSKTDLDPRYQEMIDRNIGLLTWEEQEKLQRSCVAIFGVGGFGGVIAEILARAGVGRLAIVDYDRFDVSNLNRQIFAFHSTLGTRKVDATERFLRDINPGLVVEKYSELNESSLAAMMRDASVAVMATDRTQPRLLVARAARRSGVPSVEAWAIPFANVRTYTEATPTWEEAYGLETSALTDGQVWALDAKACLDMDARVLMTLTSIEGMLDYYSPELVRRMQETRKFSSFAPMVWLTSALMANEALKAILGWDELSLAPRGAIFDPFGNRIPRMR